MASIGGFRVKRPTTDAMVANIAGVFSQASADERSRGERWYPLAHAIVCEWADSYGRSIANVASIIAAISPQCEWSRNLIIADDVLAGRAPSIGGALQANLRNAERIRDERLPNTLTVFKVGCKVANFAVNLAGDYVNAVTVDTHAAQIAAGSPAANLRVGTWAQYEPVASAYKLAAGRLGIEPATLQAITWVTWKRLYTPERKRVIRRRY